MFSRFATFFKFVGKTNMAYHSNLFPSVEPSCAWGLEDSDPVGCTYGFIAQPKKLSIATFDVKYLMICG